MQTKKGHYYQGKAPTPKDIHCFLKSIKRRAKKKGTKFYNKHRTIAEKRIKKQADKFNISGTITSRFWKLKALCILIGVEKY